MPLQETGVKAEIQDIDQFMAGLKLMNLGVANLGKAIADTNQTAASSATGMKEAGNAGKFFGGVIQTALGATGNFGAVLAASAGGPVLLGAAIAGAAIKIGTDFVGSVNQAISSVEHAIQSFANFAQEGLMLAGRFNEMENAAIAVGRSYGIIDDETRAAIEVIEDAGIRYDVAASSALQLIRNQIDLANSTDLVAIAQATGIIVGADSSETMGRLTHAIATGNTAMLGYMGILVKKNDIEREAQDVFGKSIDALTQQEKMQARVNAIIKSSAGIMEVYGSAMESPTKALRSLTGREIPTLGATMMQTFIPAFKTAIDAVRGLVKAITKAMDEGGSLYPILVNLGAAASLVADAFKAASDWVFQWINDLNVDISEGAANTIELMARWGTEMIAVFAEAIVNTAASALTQAMQFVSSVLTFWMAPGSPPRIAPDIDKWGAATLTEWLKGMTKADFGVLGGIQNTLSKVLEGPEFRSISVQVAGFLGGEEALGAEFFAELETAAGDFGKEISTLVRGQIMLADATRAVEVAEQKLKASREAVSDAQLLAAKLTREYNELLREGAPPEILDAKLEEVRVAEGQIDLAKQQVKESEAAKEEAKAVAIPLKEQVELQNLLVQQLIKMREEEEKLGKAAAKTAKAAKVKAGEIGIPELGLPEAVGIGKDITNRIAEAVEAAKAALKEKLADIFKPLTTAWETSISPTLKQLREDFNEFVGIIQDAWAAFTESDTYKTIIDFWNNLPATIAESVQAFMDQEGLLAALEPFTSFIDQLIEDVTGKSISDWLIEIFQFGYDDLFLFLKNMGEVELPQWMKDIWAFGMDDVARYILGKDVVGKIESALSFGYDDLFRIMGDKIAELWPKVEAWIADAASGVAKAWNKFWDDVNSAIEKKIDDISEILLEWLEELFEDMRLGLGEFVEYWEKIWEDVKDIVNEIWKRIISDVKKLVNELRENIEREIGRIRDWLSTTWNIIKVTAIVAWDSIKSEISKKVRKIKDAIQNTIRALKSWWDAKWESFKETVATVWQGIKDALNLDELYETVVTGLESFITGVSQWISDNIKAIQGIGEAIVNGIKEGFLNLLSDLIEAGTSFIEEAINGIKEGLGIPVQDMMNELSNQMSSGIEGVMDALPDTMDMKVGLTGTGSAIAGAPLQAMVSGAGGSVSNRSSVINIGTVNVNGGMSWGEFSSGVKRAVMAALT